MHQPIGEGWTDARVELLKTLWMDGAPLASMKVALKLTGSAICGKADRVGLPKRRNPATPRMSEGVTPRADMRASAPQRYTPPAALSAPKTVVAPSNLPAQVVVPIRPFAPADLPERDACKWPIGHPGASDFSFCARPAKGSYCQEHTQIAYLPSSALRKRAKAS